MSTNKISELSKILNTYEDIEKDIYYRLEYHLMNEGINFSIFNFTLKNKQCFIMGQFQKSNISFVELLSNGFYIIGNPNMEWVESGRMNPKKPLLFHDEVIVLTFYTKENKCSEFRILNLDPIESYTKTKSNNLLFDLPESFINDINLNKEITINVKIISSGNFRKIFKEKAMFVNTELYADILKSKKNLFLTNTYNKIDQNYINLIKHRALLWDIKLDKKSIPEIESLYKNLPSTDFGIKNITKLRAFFNNFNNPNISNEVLFKENETLTIYLNELNDLYEQLNHENYTIIYSWKNLFKN